MRVLVFPFFSNAANLNGCSAYNWARRFVERTLDKDDNLYYYFIMPEGRWKYEDDGLFGLPRVKVIKMPMYSKGQRESIYLATKEFWDVFNERTGQVVYDAILTDRISLVPFIKSLTGHFVKSKRVNIPVIVKDHFLLTQETARGTPEDVEVQQVNGMYCADKVIFQSPLTRERGFRMVKKYLNPSKAKKVIDKSAVINFGIDIVTVDQQAKAKKFPLPTILFSQRLEINANWEFIFNVLNKVYASGKEIQTVVCTNNRNLKQLDKIKKKFRHFLVFSGITQEKYLEIVSKCHAFIIGSRFEEYPTVAFEALRLGLVGIFPQREWVDELLGEKTKRVLRFKDTVSAAAQIDRVANFGWADYKNRNLTNWVGKEHSTIRGFFEVLDFIRDAVKNKKYPKVSKGLMGVTEESAYAMGDKFPASMIYDAVRRHSKNKVPVGKDKGAYGITKFMVREALFRLGYRDNCKKEYPIYEKVS